MWAKYQNPYMIAWERTLFHGLMNILELFNKLKKQVQEIPCLYIVNPLPLKIVETSDSELGYGGILKQV